MTSYKKRRYSLTQDGFECTEPEERGRIQEEYDYPTLHTWVQRPGSIAQCFVSDVYGLRAVIPQSLEHSTFLGRDVFMLNQWPCRMVHLVGWVAGVDQKEKSSIITLDDGDGQCVLPITVYLNLQHLHKSLKPMVQTELPDSGTFLTSRQRRAQLLRAAAEAQIKEKSNANIKGYVRKDIRVGDVVRVVGRVNEYPRRKMGDIEWVREVVVDDASGGSVDEEEQFVHTQKVLHLHSTLYSRPFIMPSTSTTVFDKTVSSPGTTFSELASSEIGEISEVRDQLRLRDPSKLRPSQLTDATYRQYIIDHMMQETVHSIEAMGLARQGLDDNNTILSLFPEMRPFGTSTRPPPIEPFSISDLLDVPHLALLARLVVDHVTRQEEKRRRRRMRDGTSRPADIRIEGERKLAGRDWRLTDEERISRIQRLTTWVIRNLHTDGAIVHLGNGYLPLPPVLMFPVLVPFVEREEYLRKDTFMRKDDPRRNNGVMVDEILRRLNKSGEEGRWERVKGWVVEDTMGWAVERGYVKKRGIGWDLVQDKA